MKKLYLLLHILFTIALIVSCQGNLSPEEDKILFERVFQYEEPTKARYAQGMDISNGYVFQGYSDGTIDVINLSTKTIEQTLGPLIDGNNNILHMNDLSFVEKDEQLLLLVPGNSINSYVMVYDVQYDNNKYQLNLLIEIPAPQMDATIYRAATQFFGKDNTCVQVAYKRTEDNGYGDIEVEGYTYDELNSEIKYVKKWNTQHELMWAMQGAVIENGKCYLAVGVPKGDAKIYQINISTGYISCYVDFREKIDTLKEEEMQGVAFYLGDLYFSTTYGLYRLL